MRGFLRRWRMTRFLYKIIHKTPEVPHAIGMAGYKPTRADRIHSGVNQTAFLQWYKYAWEHFDPEERFFRDDSFGEKLYYNLPWRKKKREYFDALAMRTLNECVERGWIERNVSQINLSKTTDAWTFYYPLLAFLEFCESKKIAWAIIIGIIGFSPLFQPFFVHWLCQIAPMVKSCHA